MKTLIAVCAAVLLCVVPARPKAAAAWIEVDSPHFRVVSNNGERSARETAWQFEQIRAGIGQGWAWANAPLDRPLLIIGLKDEGTMKLFAPQYYEAGKSVRYSSISAGDWDRHYIAMRADLMVDGGEGVNPYRTAYWTYCDLMLSSAFQSRLPMWFERGMAAVLSNTNVTEKEIQFGRAVPSYVSEFRSGARFSLEQMFAITRQSPEFQREVDLHRFDAQAWALMHFMLFGDADPTARDARLNTLAAALTAGTPPAEAVAKAYGSLADLDTAYRRYADRGLFRFATMKTELMISMKDFSAAPVDPAVVAAIRAGYLAASRQTVDAAAAIAESRKLAPSLAASYEVEGLMLDKAQKADEASVAYEKAVELKSENFLPYVRLATMLQRTAGPELLARRRTLLEKSIALNPNYAQSLLGLGGVYMQLGLKDDALAAAKAALAVARSENELRSAQSLLDAIARMR